VGYGVKTTGGLSWKSLQISTSIEGPVESGSESQALTGGSDKAWRGLRLRNSDRGQAADR